MTREILNAINVSLDGYSVLISLIIAISILSIKQIDASTRWFAFTNVAAIVFGLSDLVMWISEGTEVAWKLIVLPVSSWLFYASGIFLFLFYIRYVYDYYCNFEKLSKKWWYFCVILVSMYLLGVCISPFTNFFYTIDEFNVYHRGKFFPISVGIELLLYFEVLFLVLKFRKKITNMENIGFASFIFCPFISQIIQIANYGIALNSLGLTISFFIIYINVNQQIKTKLHKTEKELKVIDNKKTDLLSNTIYNLANLIEFNEMGSQHVKRVTLYSRALANACKKNGLYENIIDENFIRNIEKTSSVHDIGNSSIPRPILSKPSKVTPEEFEIIKNHTLVGSDIVNQILAIGHERDFIKMATDICKYHHERWDGKGYPEKLKGKEIPLCARIVSLADAFDALVTTRCYKKTVSVDEAFRVIDNESGKQFDPELVMEFLKLKKQVKAILNTYSDTSYEE